MERAPFLDQSQCACAQVTFQYRTIVDAKGSLIAAVFRVEMRRRMIVVVHRDDDAEKPAYLWHACLLEMAIGRESVAVAQDAQRVGLRRAAMVENSGTTLPARPQHLKLGILLRRLVSDIALLVDKSRIFFGVVIRRVQSVEYSVFVW